MASRSTVIHLDTHVVVWLYAGEIDRIPPSVRTLLGSMRPLVSPMVRLELAFLRKIGRITAAPGEILETLEGFAGLGVSGTSFDRVTQIAATLAWTRDPFDRMIAAHALADDLPLLTKDRSLLENCPVARWA